MATEESKRVSLDGSSSSVSMKAQDKESGVVILSRHLPAGIISDIISRLPLEDIIRCSSVSTDWYRITKNLRSNHLHNTKSQILDILLAESGDMSFDYVGVDNSLHMLSSNSRRSDGKCKHVEIANENELTGRVIGSCNGLLCLAYQMGSPYAIYNPITKETMMLPELELHPQCDKPFAIRAGFGYDPINNKYKVVVAYDYRRYINKRSFTLVATGDIITLGESSWRRLQFPEEVKGRIDTYQPAVFINGAFHWLNGMQHDYEYSDKETYQLDGILTLDISTEKFKVAKFSAFVDLDVSRIEVFTIGSSLALLGQKLDDHSYRDDAKPPPTKIWKILGENADGGCLYQCMTLNVGVKTMQLLTEKSYLTPVGAVGNDKFLFKASNYGPNGKLNCLVLYDTELDEGYVLEVPAEVPKDWDATIFQPSLVHPPSSGKCTFT